MAGGGVERLSRLSDPEVANSILAHMSDSSRVSRLLSSERPAFPRLHGHEQVAYAPIDPVGNHDLDVARRLAVHRFHDPPMGYIPFIGDETTKAHGDT